jgi:hypothetical protein
MIRYLTLFLICCLCFISCKKSLFNAGDTASKEFRFSRELWVIEIQNIFEIRIVQDTVNKAIVTCGENLLPDIHFHESDHILYLDHSVSYNWSRDYEKIKVELHLNALPRINIRKPVYIETLDTFNTKELVFVVWDQFAEIKASINAEYFAMYTSLDDFGQYTISGKCKRADINPSGSGVVDCRHLITEECSVWQRSIADTYINVSKKLTVRFKERGNIYYWGNPDTIEYVNQPVSGLLIKQN